MLFVSRIWLIVLATASLLVFAAQGQEPSAGTSSPRGIVSIGNAAVRVEFDPGTGRMTLSDLRCQAVWKQTSQVTAPPRVKSVDREADGRAVRAELDTAAGLIDLVVEVQEPAEVLVRLIPRGAARAAPLTYPLPLAPPQQAELVLPPGWHALTMRSVG